MSRPRSSSPGEAEKLIRRDPREDPEPLTLTPGPPPSRPKGAFAARIFASCAPISLALALLVLFNSGIRSQLERHVTKDSGDAIIQTTALESSSAILLHSQQSQGQQQPQAQSQASFPVHQKQEPDATSPRNTSLPTKAGSVAICLAGGLRMFELTAQSIVRHLFASYPGADVFVSAPLTEESSKLLLLKEAEVITSAAAAAEGAQSKPWSLKGVHFITQEPLEETEVVKKVLSAGWSPNGLQGLLQYFQLVEGCSPLIAAQEQQQGFKYDWVARARPDSYWNGPAPALDSLNPEAYSYPQGSRYRGLNDRFGIGKRNVAEGGLRRLSVLADLPKVAPTDKHNSERALKAQLETFAIPFQALPLPFCVISLRPYKGAYGKTYVPVFDLSSTAPVSGAKCRPCTPVVSGQEAIAALQRCGPRHSLPYDPPPPAPSGFNLCNNSLPWAKGWEGRFDEETGPGAASIRRLWANLSDADCASKLRRFLGSVPSYTGPVAEVLCSMRPLGPVLKELFNVNSSLASANAAFASVGSGIEQPLVQEGTMDLGTWDGLQLPVLSQEQLQRCEACFTLVHLSSSTGDMSRKQSLVAEMQRKGWQLIKCGGKHSVQVCLLLLLKSFELH